MILTVTDTGIVDQIGNDRNSAVVTMVAGNKYCGNVNGSHTDTVAGSSSLLIEGNDQICDYSTLKTCWWDGLGGMSYLGTGSDRIYDAGLGPRISLCMFMMPQLMTEGGREFQDVSAAQLNDRLPTTTVLHRENSTFLYALISF